VIVCRHHLDAECHRAGGDVSPDRSYRMLTADELNRAIKRAQREAAVCTRFCVVGGECRRSGYAIFHNGLGSSDTSEQIVSHEAVLRLPEEHLASWLVPWLVATHKRERFDLNRRGRDHPAL
jgi:hypothetical protein